jgi:hypothetical protein
MSDDRKQLRERAEGLHLAAAVIALVDENTALRGEVEAKAGRFQEGYDPLPPYIRVAVGAVLHGVVPDGPGGCDGLNKDDALAYAGELAAWVDAGAYDGYGGRLLVDRNTLHAENHDLHAERDALRERLAEMERGYETLVFYSRDDGGIDYVVSEFAMAMLHGASVDDAAARAALSPQEGT